MFHDIIIMAPTSEHDFVFIIIYALITSFATIGIMCCVHNIVLYMKFMQSVVWHNISCIFVVVIQFTIHM